MSAVAKIEPMASEVTTQNQAAAVFSLIERMSTDASISIERVEQAFAFYERVQASQARRAFDAAMAAARAELPIIKKNREVDFTSQKGRTNYRYEDLAEIARVVDPILAKHGLAYRFVTRSNVNEPIHVTCIVSHSDGHCSENTLAAGRDETGNKNAIQAIGSTITFLQRYTLKASLGLAVSNDDDGKAANATELISEDQFVELSELMKSAKATPIKFCETFGIESVGDLPAKRFGEAKARLQARIIELGKGKP